MIDRYAIKEIEEIFSLKNRYETFLKVELSVLKAYVKLGTIPEVVAKKHMIEKAMSEEFWESADIFELDEVRIALRDLLKYIENNMNTTLM